MSAAASIAAPTRLRRAIPCALEKVRPLAREIRDFLREHDISEEDVMGYELALVEACNNAVLYATEEGKSQTIEVEAECTASKVEFRIHDHTEGFELPREVNLPMSECESGRGIFIIQSIMDSVSYERGRGKNCLIMSRQRGNAQTDTLECSRESFNEISRKLAESEQVISEMAEELSSCYETLSAIFRCGTELGKTNNVHEFSRSLCNDLLQITNSDWYVLRVTHNADSRLTLYSASDATLRLPPISIPGSSAGNETFRSAELKAVASKNDVWFNSKAPLHGSDPLAQILPNSFGIVHPFFFAENLMGTLVVGKAASKSPFTAAQANVVHTFADFLAIQIVNSRLQEEQLKSRLISRELEIAKTIQLALLPKTFPQLPGFELAGYCESARQVGGDFYDVVSVSKDSVLLIIADVMGKGIPAAMFAAILRSLLRATPEYNRQPSALLARVNRLLYEELSEVEMFITAQLVFIDFTDRKIIAASAGHCPVLLAAPSLTYLKSLSPDGIPLGILPDAVFTDSTENLPDGARILLYTDGITDAQNGTGTFFGEQRLLAWFQNVATQCQSANELKSSLAAELCAFQNRTALYDDQTFLLLAEANTKEEPCRTKS